MTNKNIVFKIEPKTFSVKSKTFSINNYVKKEAHNYTFDKITLKNI